MGESENVTDLMFSLALWTLLFGDLRRGEEWGW